MSLVTETAPSAAVAQEASAALPIVNVKPAVVGAIGLTLFYICVRTYEGAFGFAYGLDAFDPNFNTYWMSILWSEIPLEFVSFLAIIGFLWKTRDRDLANVAPREELRRLIYLMGWIVVYGVAIYWGASYFTEQDGTWHQTVIRDTDFTPSHIIEFYMSYPIYIIVGVGGFMYARTRLPIFGTKGYSIAYLLLFIGPFMIFPNVALNEWGHTFWFMEELFVAPLHWMFVFFGWFALAVFGVSLQILSRIGELFRGYEDLCGLDSSVYLSDLKSI
jgi:methane/ammonia monooxygenase subunit C